MQLVLCQWQNWQTAEPKPADCLPTCFSEGRAMQTVRRLANSLPHRQVCTIALSFGYAVKRGDTISRMMAWKYTAVQASHIVHPIYI